MAFLPMEMVYAQQAQPDDLIIMRRHIAPRKKPVLQQPGLPGGEVPKSGYYSWKASPWIQTAACGEIGTQTRRTWCERTDGTKMADVYCTGSGSGPKPFEQMQAIATQTCEFQWKSGAWQGDVPACGSVTQTRTNACTSRAGGVIDPEACKGDPPATSQVVTNYAGCSFQWNAGRWSDLQKWCGDVTVKRIVSCLASDGSTAPNANCAGSGPAPEDSYTYQFPTCNGGGSANPEDSRGWMKGEWTPVPSNMCGVFLSSRVVQCVSGTGVVVSDAECSGDRPESTREVESNSACTYSWTYGPLKPVPEGCGFVQQTRTVACLSSDGRVVKSDFCVAEARPDSSFPVADYRTCEYKWDVGDWSEWSNSCGEATRARVVACKRSDNTVVEDAQCGGERPLSTETQNVAHGCPIEWATGPWMSEATCGDTTQTRTVACLRTDGQEMPEANCRGEKPGATREYEDLTTCSFKWATGEYGEPSTTCGTATVSRPVSCQRSDGKSVEIEFCKADGPMPSASYQVEMATNCSYQWSEPDFGAPAPACGSSVRSRTSKCVRSDKREVADAFCTGEKPDQTMPVQDYTTCTYEWAVSQWNNDGSCGESAVQTRTVTCQRSEGTAVSDGFCSETSPKPASSQTVSDYSGCTYEWHSEPGPWSSGCSTTATRTNQVTCNRSDGNTVSDDYCSGNRPPATETGENLAQCSYVGIYDNWTDCKATTQGSMVGTQTGTLASCQRSDGLSVDKKNCGSTQTRACEVDVDRYVREPSDVADRANLPASIRVYNQSTSATLGLTVVSTLCWDRQVNAQTGNATCANLPTGANIYDIMQIPAVYSSDFREVYIKEDDLKALVPHGTAFGYQPSYICRNGATTIKVNQGAEVVSYGLSCGAPEQASNYVRRTSNIVDPEANTATRNKNTSYDANSVIFAVSNTQCVNLSNNQVVNNAKCTYLPTGSNIYDLVSIPATLIKELREIYVNKADLDAATVNVTGYATSFICSPSTGWQMKIGPEGDQQTWVLRCGTPPETGTYKRVAYRLDDPYAQTGQSADYRSMNKETGAALSLAVMSTSCQNIKTNSTESASKCQYLTEGANIYDMITLPATYVKGLREVYISMNDVNAAMPYGGTALGGNVTNICSTTGPKSIAVTTAEGVQTWGIRCGTPDDPASYSKEINTLADPATITSQSLEYRHVNRTTGATYTYSVYSTICIDKRTNASADAAKCQYSNNGVNVGDTITVPAVYVPSLREVYIQKEDIIAKAPYAISVRPNTGSSAHPNNVCTRGMGLAVDDATVNYTHMCGAPDSADNYEKVAYNMIDVYRASGSVLTTAQKNTNTSSKSTVTFSVDSTICRNKQTGSTVSGKCDYITGDNVHDLVEVPATYVQGLREVYFDKGALLTRVPNLFRLYYWTTSTLSVTVSNMCTTGFNIWVGEGSSRVAYKAYCDRQPDTADHYEMVTALFGDPYYYYSSTYPRYANVPTSGQVVVSAPTVQCMDTATKTAAADGKCDYIPGGVARYANFTIPGIWNATAKTVTVNLSDLKSQISANTPETAYGSRFCNNSLYTTSGNFKVVCQ